MKFGLVGLDRTPYEVKISRTVWSGGKGGELLQSLTYHYQMK
ncbi:hypothetical protein [Niallia sp. Marseille-Q9988]|uniref:Uncharacterized protein n=1 Tax=Niallia hominis TaxID=3133173 RepID=A0ABV1EZB2_9BACI